jgi:hypothetical protein
MSLADPQSITIAAVTTSLPRISVGDEESTYASSDGQIVMRVSHERGKGRVRRLVRVDTSKIGPDVFRDDLNVEKTAGIYVVIDQPEDGFTPADLLAFWTGFKTQLAASSDAIIVKLLGGEN